MALTTALLALAINKQLDLQSWVTQLGRTLAYRGGWYGQRRAFQSVFVLVLALLGLLGFSLLAFLLRRLLARVGLAAAGLAFLITFVAVRASSFHHVDVWLRSGRIRLNWVLELGGIALIAICAWRQGQPTRADG